MTAIAITGSIEYSIAPGGLPAANPILCSAKRNPMSAGRQNLHFLTNQPHDQPPFDKER